jgi:hypothetical protein
MNHSQGFSGPAENRLKANHPSLNTRPANRGNLIMFPISRTSQHLEAVMSEHGDDAGHCPNGLSAQNYQAATAEDRATYRKWIRGTVVFYSTLLLISGVVAIVNYSSTSLTRLTSLSARPAAVSPGSN